MGPDFRPQTWFTVIFNRACFEQQQEKRKREVAALEAQESRTEEEEATLVEYRRQIESLQKKIEQAASNVEQM